MAVKTVKYDAEFSQLGKYFFPVGDNFFPNWEKIFL